MISAFEAAASCTSEAVIPPTPLAITLTCTSSVERLFKASRKAAALVEHRAHAAELRARDDGIAHAQRAALDQHGRDRAAALLDAGLNNDAARKSSARRFQFQYFGLQQDGIEQLVDAGARARRDV